MAVAKFTYARKFVINGSRTGSLIVVSSFQDLNDTKWNDTKKRCSKTVMKLSKYKVMSKQVWSANTVKPQMRVITNMQKSTANRILKNKNENSTAYKTSTYHTCLTDSQSLTFCVCFSLR